MKALFLVQSVDSVRPGPDSFIVDWVCSLATKVDHLTILTYHYNPREKLPVNTKVVLIHGSNPISRNFNLFWKTLTLARSENIDFLFAHILEVFGVTVGVVGRILGKKSCLWYCQGYDLRKNHLAQIALRLVDKVFTATEELKISYAKQLGVYLLGKVVVVGHGIDTKRFFSAGHRSFPIKGEKVRIAYAGRLTPIKDIFTMLSAIGILQKEGYPVSFELIGDWGIVDRAGKIFQQDLKQKISQINSLKKVVIFDGPKAYSYDQTSDVFSRADIFIVPAKVYLEVLASGITAVGQDAIASLFQHDFLQLFYKTGDSRDLSTKLTWLINHPNETRAITSSAQQFVAKNFGIDSLMSKVIYENSLPK